MRISRGDLRVLISKTLVAVLLVTLECAAAAGDFVFENDVVRLTVDDRGRATGLRETESGRNWLRGKPAPLFAAKKDGKWHDSAAMWKDGDNYRIVFGKSGISATYAIRSHKNCLVLELMGLQGDGIQAVRLLQLRTQGLETDGHRLAVRWNEQFSIVPLGLSPRVHANLTGAKAIMATVYPEFGMEGERVALVAVPTETLMDTIQAVEQDFGLPSPSIDGQWAKKSDAIRTSYLFIDLNSWNVEEVIRYAKLGGFGYVLIYASTWSSSLGSYPINLKNYPKGESSFKAVVDKVHDAGLRVGVHTLTSLVSRTDPLVTPVPDHRLLKDAETVLAADINEGSTEIPVTAPLQGFPGAPSPYEDKNAGLDIQIGDEILQCRDIGASNLLKLKQCTRGVNRTRASYHQRGAKIHHLAQRKRHYLADLRTSLKHDISERIAGLINRLGLDMVYFDGGAMNDAYGSAWYWASQQQDDTLRRVRRGLLAQGSGWTQWTWHWFARGACDDYVHIATVPYLDNYKIKSRWRGYKNNFMPAELGWWAILNDTTEHHATTLEEVEHHGVRMIALDAPISLETSVADLNANGRTEELLAHFGELEKLRTDRQVSRAVRQRLETGHWHWDRDTRKFHPMREKTWHTKFPGQLEVEQDEDEQLLTVRVSVLPSVNEVGDAGNMILYHAGNPMMLPAPDPQVPLPGALIRRIEITDSRNRHVPLDLSDHRAIAVRIRLSGKESARVTPHPILNIQLESANRAYRDHYVVLDFLGEKTLTIRATNSGEMLPDMEPSPKNYSAKSALRGFVYDAVTAINLRWMRYPVGTDQRVELVLLEALAERTGFVNHLRLGLAGAINAVPVRLKTGDYIEFSPKQEIRVFSPDGNLLHRARDRHTALELRARQISLGLSGDGEALVELKLNSLGRALPDD